MTDHRYRAALIQAWNRGVPVRVLCDLRAPARRTQSNIQTLIDAGIPYAAKDHRRHQPLEDDAVQGTPSATLRDIQIFPESAFHRRKFRERLVLSEPITDRIQNYVDEAIYFTDDSAIVQSFMQSTMTLDWTR